MKTTIYRFSVRAVGLLIILGLLNWFLVSKQLGYRASEVVGYLSMIVSLSMIFFAIRHFRRTIGNGRISFGQGFRIGILITLITSAAFYVYTYLFFILAGEEFKDYAMDHFKSELSAEQYQEFLSQMQQPLWNSPLFQGLVMFLTVFFIGLIITLISATVLKKD